MKYAMPDAKLRPKTPDMAARNSGSSQPIDATAYDTPNNAIDPRPRVRPPLSSLGARTVNSKPASNAMPNATRPSPITSEIQGATSYTLRVTWLTNESDDCERGREAES